MPKIKETKMDPRMVECLEKARAFHREIYSLLDDVLQDIGSVTDMHDQANLARVAHEIVTLAEDLRKEAKKLKETSSKIACVLWVKDDTGESIRTRFVTATPKVRMIASVPKQGTEEHNALMKHLGVPSELIESGVATSHWPSLMDYLSDRQAEGYPLPPGIDPDKTYPKYSLTINKRDDPCSEAERMTDE